MTPSERYTRQIMLPEIGISGQQALERASVLIVGVGGLGSPIALYLCSAGIGRIGLVDGDTVSESNLQRQILYTEEETGQSKVERAARTLAQRNSACRIDTYPYFLNEENAEATIKPYDIVVDGCDNYATRYLIDDWCHRLIGIQRRQGETLCPTLSRPYGPLVAARCGRCHRPHTGCHRQHRGGRSRQAHHRLRRTAL